MDVKVAENDNFIRGSIVQESESNRVLYELSFRERYQQQNIEDNLDTRSSQRKSGTPCSRETQWEAWCKRITANKGTDFAVQV